MITAHVVIENEVGLHARPAAAFVKTAERFASKVFLEKDGIRVNGRSILSVLTLAAEKGSTVILVVDGPDEQAATEALRLILAGAGNET